MKNYKNYLLIALFITSSTLFSDTSKVSPPGLYLDWLNSRIKPQEDFYSYANGTWQQKNPIPPEYSSWTSFNQLQEKIQQNLHGILKEAANDKQAAPGSIEKKVGDFYISGMNEILIDQLNIKPLDPMLKRIDAIKNIKDLQQTMAYLQSLGVKVFFDFQSMQDFKNSTQMIGALVQSGLGLPDRDYYLKKDKKFQSIREAYVKHIAIMLELLGDSSASVNQKAKAIMAIETTFAKASMTQIEQRDPYAVYHIMTLKELEKRAPNISWHTYFTDRGGFELKSINVAMPKFIDKINQQLPLVSIEDWKAYLRWQLVNAFAAYLSKPFVEEDFHMNAILTGAEKLLPRWKRVVNAENAALGFAVGKLYVKKYFSQQEKENVLKMMANIRKAMEEGIKTLDWMTPTTKKAALKKLKLMEERVGYPEKWWDYSSLEIHPDTYLQNAARGNAFVIKRELNKIGKPVDRTEWAMTPQTVNAYYDVSMNSINIPAGILQPPFYDPKAPPAVNYGGIGFVIGHEITHGFDDQGAKFDGLGNLKDWWQPMDLKKFQAATDCIVQQFSQYKAGDNLSVQGKLVVGEATADLGGAIIAYKAFRTSKDYKKAKTIEGFTPNQQFFLSIAHVWAGNMRPEYLRNLVTTDPHPPINNRVNGTLANLPAFQSAFSIREKSPMVNIKRCVVWQ